MTGAYKNSPEVCLKVLKQRVAVRAEFFKYVRKKQELMYAQITEQPEKHTMRVCP